MIKLVTKNWQIENVETVLFDKDGTLVDLHYFWGKMTEMRVDKIIRKFKLTNGHFAPLCEFLGYDIKSKKMLSDGITALYSRPKIIEIFKNNLEEIGLSIDKSVITEIFDLVSIEFYKEIEKHTKPIDEAIDFIKDLRKQGIKTGIVTSDSVESTNLTIKNQSWENLFDVIIGRESSVETKESGIPTKIALDYLNAMPETTIMIGDAPMDYISAKNAGINKTVLVATGQISSTKLSEISPYVLETLKDIKCLKT